MLIPILGLYTVYLEQVFVIVGASFQSLVIPLRAVLTIAFTLIIVFGAAVAVYQHGALNWTVRRVFLFTFVALDLRVRALARVRLSFRVRVCLPVCPFPLPSLPCSIDYRVAGPTIDCCHHCLHYYIFWYCSHCYWKPLLLFLLLQLPLLR